MEPKRKKIRETKLASVNYEKPDFGIWMLRSKIFHPQVLAILVMAFHTTISTETNHCGGM
jgi:hypothetical protein